MKIKKILMAIMAAVLILNLSACGKTAAESENTSAEEVSEAATEAASEEVSEDKDQEAAAGTDQSAAACVSSDVAQIASSDEAHITDITLICTDNKGKNYTFLYDGSEYSAIYTTDNWKILDSYTINDEDDMLAICQALIDEHPVHGRDMVSFRTAEDMVYEWEMHNMAYFFLPDDDPMKKKARDVDFDPKDQGRTFEKIYYDRTGKEPDLNKFFENP